MKRHLINPRRQFPVKSPMMQVLALAILMLGMSFSTLTASSKFSLSERIYLSVNNKRRSICKLKLNKQYTCV